MDGLCMYGCRPWGHTSELSLETPLHTSLQQLSASDQQTCHTQNNISSKSGKPEIKAGVLAHATKSGSKKISAGDTHHIKLFTSERPTTLGTTRRAPVNWRHTYITCLLAPGPSTHEDLEACSQHLSHFYLM
jgi:hypothetical protein